MLDVRPEKCGFKGEISNLDSAPQVPATTQLGNQSRYRFQTQLSD